MILFYCRKSFQGEYTGKTFQDIMASYERQKQSFSNSGRKLQMNDNSLSNLNSSLQKGATSFKEKQGYDKDIPRKPSVLKSSSKSMKCKAKQKQMSTKNILQQSPTQKQNPASGTVGNETENKSEKFYKYCTQQIVRVSNLNTKLQNELSEIKNQLQRNKIKQNALETENNFLKEELSSVKSKLKIKTRDADRLQVLLDEESNYKVRKLKEEFQFQQYYRGKTEQMRQEFMAKIKQKDKLNAKLIQDMQNLKLENIKQLSVEEDNRKLKNRLQQTIFQNTDLKKRQFKSSQAVDHLWQIKNIEYEHMKKLLPRVQTQN